MNRFQSRRNRDRFQSRGLFYSILFFGCFGFALLYMFFHTKSVPSPGDDGVGMPRSIHDITVKDISGKDVTLSTYSGKVLLIVNVASKCGFTDLNYKEMNVLYKKYRSKGFEILAFPCNQFGGQEPGSNEEIEKTCKALRAKFPIFEKVEVNGNNASALYKFLKAQKDGIFGDSIKWNFTKFLVDKYGKVVQRYAPTTSPLQFEDDIKILLGVL